MLATEWDEATMDPTGWAMTEKYDGMRLYWNGSQFFTRQGRKVRVPESLIKKMPSSISLDGELWTQYGLHQEVVSICTKGKHMEKWNKVVFWVFDTPTLAHSSYDV